MSRIWVTLGRNGDIMNMLPLLWADAQKGERPRLMVAAQYASLLDGVSYVEPIVFPGAHHELDAAVEAAQVIDPNAEIVCTQVNGPREAVMEHVYKLGKVEPKTATSFQKEMWRVAGRLKEWGSQREYPHWQYPLVFDKRNPEREEALCKHLIPKRSFVLLAADGISSPFPYKPLLKELLKLCGCPVIDIGNVKADRHYDLLPLYEKAKCIVAIDSAPLHLANAVPSLPVIALVNDQPTTWNGSAWRANHVFYCRYHDFPERAVEMLESIRSCKRLIPDAPKTVHVFNAMNTVKEMQAPNESWEFFPITKHIAPYLNNGVPRLRDVLKMAMQRAGRVGLVCLSRPSLDLSYALGLRDLTEYPCYYAYRINIQHGGDQHSPFCDFFCARATWWADRLDQIPDLYLNNDYFWGQAIWTIFKAAGAKDITGEVTRIPPTEPKVQEPLSPSAAHNQKETGQLAQRLGVYSRYPKVSEQVEQYPLDKSTLFPFGYNPTVIQGEEGFKVFAYRFHPDLNSPKTKVAIAQVDDSGRALTNRAHDFYEPAEDPKLFQGPRWPYLSIVCSMLPDQLKSIVRYCEVNGGKPQGIVTPNVGKNDWSAMEKNFVFWFQGGKLFCIYRCSPGDQLSYELDPKSGSILASHITLSPVWPYGEIRGGTAPIDLGESYLRFFHSRLNNEMTGHPWRYYVGAYLMAKEPPFAVIRVSKKPILYGSEVDDLKVKERPPHWKANVVFPGGAFKDNGNYCLAVGINDSACMLAKITEKELNL